MARPNRYSKKLGRLIADRHAGGKALSEIVAADDMPAEQAQILEWAGDYPEFAAMLQAAQASYLSVLADECIKIANESKDDPNDEKAIQRAKLLIDTRMKIIEKLAPDKYGKGRRGAEANGPGAAKGPKVSDNELVRRIMFGIDRARRGRARSSSALKIDSMEIQEG